MKLTIDSEFKNHLPALSKDAIDGLECLIKKHGCRESIVTWNGVIVDGHNRYDICTRNQIKFDTVAMEFTDREAALDWIDENAIGKRNLTPDQTKDIIGRRYNRTKKAQGGDMKSDDAKSKAQNGTSINTAATIAKQHGVSKNTVKRAGEFADAVDKLGLKDDVKSGKLKRSSAKVVDTAKRGIPELIDMLNTGEITFKTAAAVAALPESDQRNAVAGGIFGINRAAKGLNPQDDSDELSAKIKREKYIPEEGKNLFIEAKIKLDRILDRDAHFQWAMDQTISYCKNRISKTKQTQP